MPSGPGRRVTNIDFDLRREELARLWADRGRRPDDHPVRESEARNIATTVGRPVRRYPINVRYAPPSSGMISRSLSRFLCAHPLWRADPARRPIADIHRTEGAPPMIRDRKNGQLAGYVYIDISGRDLGGYVGKRPGTK